MPDTIRTFIAIEPPEPLMGHLGRLQGSLESYGLNIRWVRPENIHLTLKFLGDIKTREVEAISQALAGPVRRLAPFGVSLKGIGIFPGMNKPRVVWAGIGSGIEEIHQLKSLVEDRLAACGFKREDRPFRAHLTMGRVKGPIKIPALKGLIGAFGDFVTQAAVVSRLSFLKSDLRPKGAVYTGLAEFKMDAEPARIPDGPR